MKSKVSAPVVVIALAVLAVLLAFMGKQFMAPPPTVKTAPPDFIDPATGRPKGQMKGSGMVTPSRGGPPGMGGAPAGGGSGGQ